MIRMTSSPAELRLDDTKILRQHSLTIQTSLFTDCTGEWSAQVDGREWCQAVLASGNSFAVTNWSWDKYSDVADWRELHNTELLNTILHILILNGEHQLQFVALMLLLSATYYSVTHLIVSLLRLWMTSESSWGAAVGAKIATGLSNSSENSDGPESQPRK